MYFWTPVFAVVHSWLRKTEYFLLVANVGRAGWSREELKLMHLYHCENSQKCKRMGTVIGLKGNTWRIRIMDYYGLDLVL